MHVQGSLTTEEKRDIVVSTVNTVVLEMISNPKPYESSFVATGSFLPLDGSKDAGVRLQGLKDYDYVGLARVIRETLKKEAEEEGNRFAEIMLAQKLLVAAPEAAVVEADSKNKQFHPRSAAIDVFAELVEELDDGEKKALSKKDCEAMAKRKRKLEAKHKPKAKKRKY